MSLETAVPNSGWKFKVQDVPPHGNCLFESVGRSLNIQARDLRKQTVQWMLAPDRKLHSELLSDWIQWNSGKSLQAYTNEMAREGVWGGGIELAVMASMTMHAIVVYGRDDGRAKRLAEFLPDGVADTESLPAICVLYVNRSHYMQMIPVKA
jgi:hypothetical protein